jgi:micrococcal nuclease
VIRLLALLALATAASAADLPRDAKCVLKGTVAHVRDGDTIEINVKEWPEGCGPIIVRIEGIDTPESQIKFANKKCPVAEVRRGLIAKKRAKDILPVGTPVTLYGDGSNDKYNRELGAIVMADGRDFAQEQIRKGMAVPYDGGTKTSWCR